VRNVLHEWTDDEPYREWEDELGRHWMYRCKNCDRMVSTMNEKLFLNRLCLHCLEEGK